MRPKLTKVQAEIMQLIRDEDWEIGFDRCGGDGRAWMQKGGLTRGGKSRTVNFNTLRALERKGYIRRCKRTAKDLFWLVRFELVKGDENDKCGADSS